MSSVREPLRFGAHAFVWIGDWTPDEGDGAIRAAAAAGFDFIEIPMLRPAAFDAERHAKALKEEGIGATVSLGLPADAHMPHHPEEALTFLGTALDKMEVLGARTLCGCIGYSLGTLTGAPPTDDETEVMIDALRTLAGDADARGVSLALEACNRYETYMVNTLEQGRDIVRAVGADNLKLHGDTYHMNIEERGFREPIVATADVLDYLHMSESHRGLVGTGTVNWDQIWAALAEVDYRGTLVLESFAAINPDIAAATCLWRPPTEPPEVLAREGLAFLREGARKHGLTG